MNEIGMTIRSSDDTFVSALSHTESQGDRADRYRSRVTRDGTVSLEIEIPRTGVTSVERWFMAFFLMIASVLVLIGIPLVPLQIVMNGLYGLRFSMLLVVPTLFIVVVSSYIRSSAFTHTTLKITRDNCRLILRGITWKSFFQIMCLPSHFNDLESGHFVETNPKESQYARHYSLRAEVESSHTEDSITTNIRLGPLSFAQDLDDEELEWLTEEINRFVRETR